MPSLGAPLRPHGPSPTQLQSQCARALLLAARCAMGAHFWPQILLLSGPFEYSGVATCSRPAA
eukprot:2917614-Rhodomonas_salina.1